MTRWRVFRKPLARARRTVACAACCAALRTAWAPLMAMTVGVFALPACNSMNGPDIIELRSEEYDAVFRACLDQAREVGMPAVLSDRSIGVIETAPRHIGSLVEPWRLDSSGFEQTVNATLQYERRRVRFEFVPTGFELPAPTGQGELAGPALPGSTPAERRFDLERYSGAIELRAWVYIERGFTTGLKPDTWSLSLTSTWTDPVNAQRTDPRVDDSTRLPTQWTPIARDVAMERTLLARVEAQVMAERAKSAGSSTPPG